MGGDDVDAHEAFENDQRAMLADLLTEALVGNYIFFAPSDVEATGPNQRRIELDAASSAAIAPDVIDYLLHDEDFAWGLLGRLYADRGVTDQFYAHLERVCRDFGRMLVDAHGNEAAEATKLQAEMALRRFIVEHDLPRRDRPPAEVEEVDGDPPPQGDAMRELAEGAAETSERMSSTECRVDHPSAGVECQRERGHDGKHHAEIGLTAWAWPQGEQDVPVAERTDRESPRNRRWDQTEPLCQDDRHNADPPEAVVTTIYGKLLCEGCYDSHRGFMDESEFRHLSTPSQNPPEDREGVDEKMVEALERTVSMLEKLDRRLKHIDRRLR